MTVDQAFAQFESEVRTRGLAFQAVAPGSETNRTTELERDGAGLRLTWDERSGLLSLDVTHGPQGGPPAGWLDLYRAAGEPNHLRADQDNFDFAEAVAHGLSLFAPDAQLAL